VEFQVEEDAKAKARNRLHGSRALGGEEAIPYFEEIHYASKLPRDGYGRLEAFEVERNDQSWRGGLCRVGTSRSSMRTLAVPLCSNPSLRATS
jgi:hypothetical protein